MKKIKLVLILLLSIVLLNSCIKNDKSENNILLKENNIRDIKVIKDNNNNIAFLLKKENKYFKKMFIVQLEKKDFEKLNKLNDFIGEIEINDRNISIASAKYNYFFTVDKKEFKNHDKSFYVIGISEHNGLFEILSNNKVHNIDDILINHLISDKTLSKVMLDKGIGRNCTSGGEGASECSTDEDNINGQNNCSVSCREGYYACCDSDLVRCTCVKEEASIDPPSENE